MKTWQNAKGEGQLMNVEFTDCEMNCMQATLFRDQVDQYRHQLIVGNVYEICQGVIKQSNSKYTQAQNEHCFVFDKYTNVKLVDDDPRIPGG